VSILSRILTSADQESGVVSIEPMRRRDVRYILPIENHAYAKPWSKSVFEREVDQIASGSRHYVVARSGRELVGYAGLWFVPDPDGDQAHVTNIVVAEAYRRTGVAREMMISLADHARGRDCVAWTLEVRITALAAQELYRRFGFAPAGIRKGYYENAEDALVMWCHDLGTADYAVRLDDLRPA
jgi:ribosomal-protein-alanine N-acetyltransferase